MKGREAANACLRRLVGTAGLRGKDVSDSQVRIETAWVSSYPSASDQRPLYAEPLRYLRLPPLVCQGNARCVAIERQRVVPQLVGRIIPILFPPNQLATIDSF